MQNRVATPIDRSQLQHVKRLVIKVGSALLTDPDSGLDRPRIAAYCDEIAALVADGMEVILVSSGAVAEGCARLGLSSRPEQIHELQAAAAVGQMGLVQAYENALADHDCGTAMVLLTHEDLADRQRYLNARATLNQLLAHGVVPIINENDTVATDEIRFGDNDTLGALVANLVQADLLMILTDVDGLMDADPRHNAQAKRVLSAAADDPALDGMVGAGAGRLGRGGMLTKVKAARLGARSGASTVIVGGQQARAISRVLAGEDIGTLLTAELAPMAARKRWIAGQLRAKGSLQVDAGAAAALKGQGVSLLAVGVTGVSGEFRRGDVVGVTDAQGQLLAQGLCNYSSAEVAVLTGARSEEFAERIGYRNEPELVHRDNLVVL